MWPAELGVVAGWRSCSTRLVNTLWRSPRSHHRRQLTFYPRCFDRNERLSARKGVFDRHYQALGVSGVQIKHLKRLEAESIGIMREVVAEFRNPVMLYSIGKDSSVMVHLARKAFFPARPPFPLCTSIPAGSSAK